jgi:hypothetical protein
MASYKHKVYIPLEDAESYFDATFNDTVYTRLRVFLLTTDLETGQMYRSAHWVDLPPPTPQTFIPSADVRDLVLDSWVENNSDVLAMQDHNVDVILSIYNGTYTE